MKKLITTLLMTVSLAFAQEFTAQEESFNALIVTHKTLEAAASKPEALPIYEAILEKNSITAFESVIVAEVAKAIGGQDKYTADFISLAESNKTGAGIIRAKATVKANNEDFEGWTKELVQARKDLCIVLSIRVNAPKYFRDLVWDEIKNKAIIGFHGKKLFKIQRAEMTKEEQIALTATQKEKLINLANRNAETNAWLAELTADLLALQLEQ
jgi:hypothetical protein